MQSRSVDSRLKPLSSLNMFFYFLIIQLVTCAAMTGIIWMVQIAVYPLFGRLKGGTFDDYHARYMTQVTYIIAPLMLIEAVCCAGCLYFGDWQVMAPSSLLLLAVWASTAFIQVPQHKKLTPEAVPALVHYNWIRSIAWTTRTGLLAWLAVA